MSTQPTVLIADDHPLVCSGLRAMLEPQFAVAGMAHHGDDVLGMVERHRPDVVLLDLSLPGRHGVELTRALKAAGQTPRVVIVTMHAERTYVDEALRAGADGYVLKTARASEVREAITEALAGRRYVMPELGGLAPAPFGEEDPGERFEGELALVNNLSRRQRDVLRLLGEGCRDPEIAERLGLSEKTVEYHRTRIRLIVGIASPRALFRLAALYAAVAPREAEPGSAPPGADEPQSD